MVEALKGAVRLIIAPHGAQACDVATAPSSVMKKTIGFIPLTLVACTMVISPLRSQALSPAPPKSFTVAVIPDTQGYVGKGTKRTPESEDAITNPVLSQQVRWLRDHEQAQRIVFVSHVGDIVDRNNLGEWRVARQWLDLLHGALPYALVVGNHDMEDSGESSLFQQHFGAERFRGFSWYGGCFTPAASETRASGNNANSVQFFSAEGIQVIHLALECNAPDEVLDWANDCLARHPDKIALISTHMDLGPRVRPTTIRGYIDDPKGRMQWKKNHGERGNTPAQMWDKLYRRHANLRLIFCGDQSRSTALHQVDIGDHGNEVHALLSDYGSAGPLRLYRFIPEQNQVQVITYDPILSQLVETTELVPETSAHQFVTPLEWTAP